MIIYSPNTPLYVHQWKIPLPVASDTTTTKATLKMPPQVNFMKISIALPMSPVFEKAFLKDLNDVLILTVLFWSDTHPELSVALKEDQQQFFIIPTGS